MKIYKGGFQKLLLSSWRYFPNNVYEKWLPALYLLLLCFRNPFFGLILVVHLALFNFEFYRLVAKWVYLLWKEVYFAILVPVWNLCRKVASLFINHLIYYALLIAGINLKKENTSALEYFKTRRKTDPKPPKGD